MSETRAHAWTSLIFVAALLSADLSSAAQTGRGAANWERPDHLTGPSKEDPLGIGMVHLRARGPGLGLAADDLNGLRVMDQNPT